MAGLDNFVDNPEPRCPVVLLLDTSGSMGGSPIEELNGGLRVLKQELDQDAIASNRVEVSIVTFGGGVEVLDLSGGTRNGDAHNGFVTVGMFSPPTLSAGGDTPMGRAMTRAISLLRERKEIYKENAIDYYRPWVFLITDGSPTDLGWENAAQQSREEEDRKGMMVFCIGTGGANLQQLARFSNRAPVMLSGLSFRELFTWVSKSLSGVSNSKIGDMVSLPPVDWSTVQA